MFSVEELEGIDVIKRGEEFIEVECGCTNNRYGDSVGKLRIYGSGKLEISCDCYPGCNGEKISPSEFEKHAGLKALSNWKTHVWVFVNGDKVPLRKTKLLKYYKGSASDPSEGVRPRRSRTVHRDELIRCVACGKDRRFLRRNKAECMIYHQATKASETWTCSNYPHEILRCEDDEERASKKRLRGCPRRSICKGCTSCVCFGCNMCRFEDCACRSCVDFIQNAEP
ncbi:protein ULTRAPETALA 1-like [Beta vulgaris subsp. vulgaris]|uniref:protein ULTRAPETALA 1-like n=1 Tax=Beta vulgaris subsp. vulgaris TaxID=3555 RepID=UPI0025495657|nr:protein ULTRAPETALA 1-like [Beta vulgaris subsp. vulgaris]